MGTDKIYAEPVDALAPFEFNQQVANVFDDMLERSVPLYRECLRRQAQLIGLYCPAGSRIYDLGCSHGNLGMMVLDELGEGLREMLAVDTSLPMLERYRQRLAAHPLRDRVVLVAEDIRALPLLEASAVVVNLTLQFLPLGDRDRLLAQIYHALKPGAILLLTEKTVAADGEVAALEQDFYYRFKAENGYSELEISQKREALETVLLPESLDQHLQRLRRVGFSQPVVWLKWFNFAGILCRKVG